MTDTVFCYHCRRNHPSTEVTQVQSKGVKRWRCRKSIVSSQADQAQRDAFGKTTSEMNRRKPLRHYLQKLPHCVLDVFNSPSNSLGNSA